MDGVEPISANGKGAPVKAPPKPRRPLSSRTRFEILKRDGFRCVYCGRLAGEVELHLDHREPVSRGGGDEPSNLVSACVDCNLGKGSVPLGTKTGRPMSTPTPVAASPGLVGKCFVVFTDGGRVRYQGIIRSQVGDQHYLIQFFDWLAGEPSTMQVVPLALLVSTPTGERDPGAWMPFEDGEHLRFWMEHRYNPPPQGEDDAHAA